MDSIPQVTFFDPKTILDKLALELISQVLAEELEPYQDHKLQAVELDLMGRYNAIGEYPKAERCAECGNLLKFDKYRNLETDKLARVLAWARFCKVKWCPMCMWRKARKVLGELISVFSQIEQDYKAAYILLTLTTKNAPLSELRALSKHMSVSWRRLTQTKAWRKSVWGFIRALEYMGDKTPNGECHLHYHSLLVVPQSYFSGGNYMTQAEWCDMWEKALRSDYRPIVDIRGIRPKSKAKLQPTSLKTPLNPALLSALVEVVKYIIKPTKIAELDNEQFATLDTQAKGLRQYNLGGIVKDIKPLPPEELDPSLWEFVEREYYKWGGQSYELERTNK
ncbi:replication protein (plasmid) [Helicobacter sp. NHP19-012]|uniref:Replication protein n=1 Tax=Helicobacter gastrofelis TaxID=2849642 RepID=A0ABM7SGQ2_9HELI|nr:protein rep [Helicobacter sp. NHP19-012]BCZ20071.1 replication protein [Helicobacter sp. NHP19-012]